MMEEALRAKLVDTAALTAIVGTNIRWAISAQDDAAPRVVMTVISGARDYTHEGRSGVQERRVQFDCWAPTYVLAKNAARAVEDALAGRFIKAGVLFCGTFFDMERDSYSGNNPRLFRTSIDARIWTRTIDADAGAIIDAFTTEPDFIRAELISQTVTDLKSADIWDDLDHLLALAAHAQQAGLVDWKDPTRIAVINGAPVFTANSGFAFDGVDDYIDTGFIPSTHAVAMTETDLLIGVYERTNVANDGRSAGVNQTGTRSLSLTTRTGAGNRTGQLMSGSVVFASSVTDARGLVVIQSNSADGIEYVNGVSGPPATALGSRGTGLPSHSVLIGAMSTNGTPGNFRPTSTAVSLAGRSLSDQKHADLYEITQAYLAAL